MVSHIPWANTDFNYSLVAHFELNSLNIHAIWSEFIGFGQLRCQFGAWSVLFSGFPMDFGLSFNLRFRPRTSFWLPNHPNHINSEKHVRLFSLNVSKRARHYMAWFSQDIINLNDQPNHFAPNFQCESFPSAHPPLPQQMKKGIALKSKILTTVVSEYSRVPVTRLGLKVASPSEFMKYIPIDFNMYYFPFKAFNRFKGGVSRFLTLDGWRCNLGYHVHCTWPCE